MAFKLRSALYKEGHKLPIANDGSNQFKKYQADLKNTYMSSKDSGVGAYPDPQTGERTFYDKKHQSYDMKKGVTNKTGSFQGGEYVMNKPKAKITESTKSNSPYPASQGGSPMNYNPITGSSSNPTLIGSYINHLSNKNNSSQGITSSSQDANDRANKRGKYAKGASSSKGSGVIPNTNVDPNVSKRPEYITPGTGSSTVKPKDTKPKNTKPATSTSTNTTKSSKPTTTLSTGSNTNKDKSGGYLKDTKNFSLGVDTKLNVAPMPKFEKTVTNARSADYDLVRAKGRGRSSRLKTRLEKRQGRVENRVDRSLDKIEARQQRQGTKYAGKMKAAQIKSEKGKTDPGYFESQKKLDNVGIRGSESPKATVQKKTKQPGMPGSTLGVSTKSSKIQVPKPNANLSKNLGTTSGSISPGPSVNVSKSKSASSNLISKPKNKKAFQEGAKRLTPNSKTTELRVLGKKNQKSVNKSSKKATKNIKTSTKHLTDIATGNKGNQHNAKAFRDQLKFEKNIKNKKTTTLASGESFKNTPKKSTKRYMK